VPRDTLYAKSKHNQCNVIVSILSKHNQCHVIVSILSKHNQCHVILSMLSKHNQCHVIVSILSKHNQCHVIVLEFGDCCRLSVKFIPETVSDRVNLSTSCQKLSAHSIQRQLTTSKLSLVRLYRYVEPWEIWVKPITGNMRVTPCTISWKWRLRDQVFIVSIINVNTLFRQGPS
jgi:hypothetical protein